MKDLKSALPHRLTRNAIPALVLTFLVAATLGCDSDQQLPPDSRVRTDFAALRSVHSDPDSVGSLDANSAPADLGRYRHAAFHPVMASRHPIR